MWNCLAAISLVMLMEYVPARAALPTTAPDPQSSFEPRNSPGVGQKLLEQMAGDWVVVKTFYPIEGNPVSVSGQCKQTMINDGRFLMSEFTFDEGAKQSTGFGIIGYDPDSGKFTSVWADSRSTRMSIRQSVGSFDGNEIILYGRPLSPPTTQPSGRSYTSSRLENGGNTLVHRQYIRLPDGNQRLILQLLMTRRGPVTRPS